MLNALWNAIEQSPWLGVLICVALALILWIALEEWDEHRDTVR